MNDLYAKIRKALTDTTPDYAGLSRRLDALAYHILQTGTADSQDAQTCHEAAEALRALLERNKKLERERNQLLDKLHCMCGSPIEHSAWEGHTPVSVYDYSLDQERSRAEAAEARVKELETLMRKAHAGDAERKLIHEALRFAVWAAGEGIAPAKGEDARGPEDFLLDYSLETNETDWETLPDRIIAALEVHFRTGAVKVKPLEWTEYGRDDLMKFWNAEAAPFGVYYRIERDRERFWMSLSEDWSLHDTPEEAKAAAQADYERRILSTLEISDE